jgi:hypothetical protein
MKNSIKTLSVTISMFVACLAYASNPGKSGAGVFGVCECMSGSSKEKLIELTLNEDLSFNYIDNSNPKAKLILNGTWAAKGNKIVLKATGYEKSFHRKWKYAKNGQCIRSRHMMNFRRICLVKPC